MPPVRGAWQAGPPRNLGGGASSTAQTGSHTPASSPLPPPPEQNVNIPSPIKVTVVPIKVTEVVTGDHIILSKSQEAKQARQAKTVVGRSAAEEIERRRKKAATSQKGSGADLLLGGGRRRNDEVGGQNAGGRDF